MTEKKSAKGSAKESAQALAERCAAKLAGEETAVHDLGIELVTIAPGSATMQMKVVQRMTNGHSLCHGGLIFTLADTAFAYACNSRNQSSVGAGASIEYLSPAYVDDTLTAVATPRGTAGRSAFYDVEVHDQTGKPIAIFRGRSHHLKGQKLVEQ